MESRKVEGKRGGSLEGENDGFGEVEGAAEGSESGGGVADAVEEDDDVAGWSGGG